RCPWPTLTGLISIYKQCSHTNNLTHSPDLMPRNLREAHEKIDEAVDRLYRNKPFASDEERLAVLFEKYQQLVAAEGK
ncbi:type IIL restriction-modification enzyme MmeI, partial [Actinotignum timonense]|uniref:type IIL restriction-modification enzyme MmeI n=1 Tax=Actinotignum timonense TaxID=1870995 RepID=UPI002A802BDE